MSELKPGLIPPLDPAQRELHITRVFDAPRPLVWQVWTDPKHLAQWWGPGGFSAPRCELDLRPGGAIYIDMQAPDGAIFPMSGTYQEIVEPELLVFTSAALDGHGLPLFEVLTTLNFAERGQQTQLTLHARVVSLTLAAAPYLAGMEPGWNQSLDCLAAYLQTLTKE